MLLSCRKCAGFLALCPRLSSVKGYGPHPSPHWPDQFSSASNGRVVGSDTLFYVDSCGQKVSNQEI